MTSFEYEGKTYELNMTRAGVRVAESAGLVAQDIADKPFTSFGLLFFAALYSQYKVNPNKAATMLDALLDAGTVDFTELFEELSEAYTALFGLGESKV